LVTGGAGFIGSELVRQLLADEATVVVYDNLSFGQTSNLPDDSRLSFHRGDIRDPNELKAVIERFQPTQLYHLAALHFIPYCVAHPLETIDVNVQGTAAVLEACKGSTVKTLVFASTAAVYAPADAPHAESDRIEGIDIYGTSKLCGEHLVRLFHRDTGVRSVIGRFFNAYGPRETNAHLIPEIVAQLRTGTTALQLGNLTSRRDYIHTYDLCTALRRAVAVSTVPLEVFNFATGQGHSAADVVAACETLLQARVNVVSTAERSRKVDRPNLVGDINKIASVTGWRPVVQIHDGLEQLLKGDGLSFVLPPRSIVA
jgi:UDP-glucose 4-epimerase